MAARTVTVSAVAVHMSGGDVWCATADACVRAPAVVAEVDGRIVVGRSAREIADREPESCVVDPLRHVDDEWIILGTNRFRFSEVVAGVLGNALTDAGVSGNPRLLVVTCPPHWGDVRRGVVASAARSVAGEVIMIDAAVVAARVALGPRAEGAVVVVDGARGRMTVARTEWSPESGRTTTVQLLEGTVSESGPDSVDRDTIVSAVVETSGILTPAALAVHGFQDGSEGPDLADSLAHAALPPVVRVGGADIALAALSVLDAPEPVPQLPVPASRSAAWLDGATTEGRRSPRRVDRRILAAAGAAVVVVGVVAGVLVSRDGSGEVGAFPVAASVTARAPATQQNPAPAPGPRPSTSVLPSASETSTPVTTGPPAEESITIGDNVIAIPTGWHTAPVQGRVEIVPNTGGGLRVVVVSREIADDMDTDDVADVLQTKFADSGSAGRFENLRRDVLVGPERGVTYTERPVDGSLVSWFVLVGPGQQTSIGCQSMPDRSAEIAEVCDVILESVTG